MSLRSENPALPDKVQLPGWRRLLRATRHACDGLRCTWRREAAFRQEVLAVAALLPVAGLVRVSAVERAALLAVLALVLIVELLNTAIEAIVDLASPGRHPLAGAAKDAGAAAVMLALLLAGGVWAVVLWPRA